MVLDITPNTKFVYSLALLLREQRFSLPVSHANADFFYYFSVMGLLCYNECKRFCVLTELDRNTLERLKFMKKKPFNWGTYITLIGVVVIFFIIFTDTIDTIYILPVLGAICLVYGIFGLVQSRGSNEAGLSQRSMLQLILGAFVIFIGMVEALHLNLTQRFWDIFLIIIVIVIAIWMFLRKRK